MRTFAAENKKLKNITTEMKHYWLYAAAAAAMIATSCKEAYDLDERLPEGYGTTLYSYLEGNGYQNVKRLVDDLGQADVLQGRGLMTMFVTDDAAFERFYQDNKWGVRRYEDLSLAQKKLLLFGSMIDQSIQVMNLSNTTSETGVVTGNAMRRATFVTMYDSIPTLTPAEMPDNKYWAYYRAQSKPIVCMKDHTVAPLMFMTEPFLVQNRITNEDVNFIYNNKVNRQSGDAYIAGTQIVEQNLRSANGFIHKVEDVLVPLDNMAEMLRNTADLSMWSSFIERYSVPVYAGRTITDSYNYEYGTNVDSVFIKRYASARSEGSTVLNDNGILYYGQDELPVDAYLKFDPGWNAYFSSDPNAPSVTVATQKNMGVMLVPDNQALEEYWNNGVGRVLRDCYGSWDNVPDDVLVKLLNNNMLNSFAGSVPSKFGFIVNSTKDAMGILPEDVSRVQLAANGAIYVTNKVFSPTEYVSVSFPALVNSNMNIIYWAIEQLEYSSYLNSIDSYYSFFIPTNEALQHYVDPKSFNAATKELWKFHYDPSKTEAARVWASRFVYDPETGLVTDSIGEVRDAGTIKDRLKDILNNHIVVGDLDSGRDYYQTKNGNTVHVLRDASGNVIGVQGSMQSADLSGQEIPVVKIYDQSKEGNGKSYVISQEPVLTTKSSVMDVIAEGEDHIFLDLLLGSELHKSAGMYSIGNISTLNNYNYTIYVPTDEAMSEYLAKGDMWTWEDITKMEEDPRFTTEDVQAARNAVNNFLRYHIQDNSVYIGQEFAARGSQSSIDRNYETAVMNELTNKFYTINVKADTEGITLTDGLGNVRQVIKAEGSYNLPAREIASNSFAVIHKIDRPLFYDKKQCEKYNK